MNTINKIKFICKFLYGIRGDLKIKTIANLPQFITKEANKIILNEEIKSLSNDFDCRKSGNINWSRHAKNKEEV
jgi:hypothetical protein